MHLVLFVGDVVGLMEGKPRWFLWCIWLGWGEAHGDARYFVIGRMGDVFIEVGGVGGVGKG